MKEILIKLFLRDLEKLKTEITSYNNEANMWEITDGIKNSGGNLCLHLLGNLQHFIGAVLGNSGYERKRDLEFSRKDVPLEEIINELEHTAMIVEKTLSSLSDNKMDEIYPIQKWESEVKTGFLLAHLLTHLNYHLGQINYHRRLLDN